MTLPSNIAITALLVSLGLASAVNAQIINRTFNVTGSSTENPFNPSTVVSVSADIGLNTYTVNFSNTTIGTGGYVGTITSFGFNTPFTDLELGANGSNVTFSSTKPGWSVFDPYGLSQGGGVFAQNLGAGTGNNPEGGPPSDGIQFGQTATFVFTLPNFVSADGFFDSTTDFTVRWQQVGLITASIDQRNRSDYGGGNDVPNTPVPEPSTYSALAGLLLLGFAAKRHFQKRRA